MNWEEKYLDLRKRSDAMAGEIGGYQEEIRMLKQIVESRDYQVKVLAELLEGMRRNWRAKGEYEPADAVRKLFEFINIKVEDKKI